MPARAPDEGPTGGRGEWEREQHDRVFRTLDDTLPSVRFPADKGELVRVAGGANVATDRDLPLVKFLQALPERRYASADDVKTTLNERWQDIGGLLGRGWGASEQAGAPELLDPRERREVKGE